MLGWKTQKKKGETKYVNDEKFNLSEVQDMENIPRVGNIRPRGAQFLTGMRLEHIVLIACPYCKMKFSHRSVLQQHVMGVHVQELELKHRQLLIYSSSKFTFPKTVHITYNESAINHREGCLASDALCTYSRQTAVRRVQPSNSNADQFVFTEV